MPEYLLHYIWQRGLFLDLPQYTTDGRLIEVIDRGQHNTDAGPDFFAVTLRIGDMTLVGNVEMHVRASDWQRHGHHTDPAYDNVILHVVRQADRETYNSRGELLVQCELRYPEDINYLDAMMSDRTTLCAQRLLATPDLLTDDWRLTLLLDRMQKKQTAIAQLLQMTANAWDQAFYITLAHHFGFHTNGLPFELMAKHTPVACLQKHRSSLFQLEAILFGQSGLLTEATATDDYLRRLWKEYSFLQKKFTLTPIDGSLWKRLRMRPQNAPMVRIAQFAALLYRSEFLLSQVLQSTDLRQLRALFQIEVSDYWLDHCGGPLGKAAIDSLLINVVVPYQYAWGRTHMSTPMQESPFDLLRSLPAEKNHILDEWRLLGIRAKNAAESQALIHLHQEYCIRQRCLSCDIGYHIFTPDAE